MENVLTEYSERMNSQQNRTKISSVKNGNERKAGVWNRLQGHDWQPSDDADMMEFSSAFHSVVEADIEKRFCKMILARLHFSDMPQRHEAIAEAHSNTFQWVLKDHDVDPQPGSADWDSFTDWLSNTTGDNLYWISGKPGSGKSTLMKYLFNHKHTPTHMTAWSKSRHIIKAGYFFWSSGTVMQVSREGLLQTLLYTILSNDQKAIVKLFDQRWQKFVAFSGGRQTFTWSELYEAFISLIGEPTSSKTYFFMIDGLDEFVGDHKDDSRKLIDVILKVAQYPHVKLCVASRPELLFSDSFESKPKLCLEQLTRPDIEAYIAAAFYNNKHYLRMKRLEPNSASLLIENIAEKAAGVFLWVYLVVQSLIDGLSNADRMSDLEARLEVLPPELEDLYERLWTSIDSEYFKHSCQLLRLVMLPKRCMLLALYFADDEDYDSAILLEARFLSSKELMDRSEAMRRRLLSRCKCLLEVATIKSTTSTLYSHTPIMSPVRHFYNRKPFSILPYTSKEPSDQGQRRMSVSSIEQPRISSTPPVYRQSSLKALN
jgi:hypothetical protein